MPIYRKDILPLNSRWKTEILSCRENINFRRENGTHCDVTGDAIITTKASLQKRGKLKLHGSYSAREI
jgi:hypothetical protein